MKNPFYSLIFLFFLTTNSPANSAEPPKIALANTYHKDINLKEYLVSEKLDGVRAYWNKKNLISKNGIIINCPNWFTKNFPQEIIEGELWISRNSFEEVSGIVRTKIPDNSSWKKVKFMLFDMPSHKGTFKERLETLNLLVSKSNSSYLKVISQEFIDNHQNLINKLKNISKNKGEWLMLHKINSFYQTKRSDDILKVKLHQDAEAKVIGYTKGKGKYSGMMGALIVENNEKIRFKIGTGFTDNQRKSPPKIGSIITYKYYGKTKTNIPKFASFMRVREGI
jgi:DNA ligase-1